MADAPSKFSRLIGLGEDGDYSCLEGGEADAMYSTDNNTRLSLSADAQLSLSVRHNMSVAWCVLWSTPNTCSNVTDPCVKVKRVADVNNMYTRFWTLCIKAAPAEQSCVWQSELFDEEGIPGRLVLHHREVVVLSKEQEVVIWRSPAWTRTPTMLPTAEPTNHPTMFPTGVPTNQPASSMKGIRF